ncbi:MAG: rhombotarget lipoprotein [Proteobacteria bacterium]|nr:rhombotarget lipoprotein [Pseudomonadota bacterium]
MIPDGRFIATFPVKVAQETTLADIDAPFSNVNGRCEMVRWWWCVLLVVLLSGCANLGCWPGCGAHTHNSSSLVEFLYPHGEAPPVQNSLPQLRIPLRVGLAFLPSAEGAATGGLDAAHQEALLERIRQRFSSRPFVAEIVTIPDYYLRGHKGFDGLEGVQRLYGVDVMALVSYDQVVHSDESNWSLGYLTIVGAYVLKGSRHDVSTLVDLAVVDPVSRSLVLRAGAPSTGHGNTTLIDADRETRVEAASGYDAATTRMIDNFDIALTRFEADVRSGKAAVQVVRKNGAGRPGSSGAGGGGALSWPWILALLGLVAARPVPRLISNFRRRGRLKGMMS